MPPPESPLVVGVVHMVQQVGATLSPLTGCADRWARFAWGDYRAAEVVDYIATGVRIPLTKVVHPFQVENYVPQDLMDWVRQDLYEETYEAGRFTSVNPEVLIGKVAIDSRCQTFVGRQG